MRSLRTPIRKGNAFVLGHGHNKPVLTHSKPRTNGRTLFAPTIVEPIRPVLISQKSNTCVIAQVGRSTRPWKLGALFKNNVCCLCKCRLRKGEAAWREASGSQNAEYRAARVCTKCWNPGSTPDQVVIINRADILDIMIGIDRKIPCSRLVITRATAVELMKKMRPLLQPRQDKQK